MQLEAAIGKKFEGKTSDDNPPSFDLCKFLTLENKTKLLNKNNNSEHDPNQWLVIISWSDRDVTRPAQYDSKTLKNQG